MANQQNDIPTFTPPVQTFTPPSDASGTRGGPSCHFHKGEPAVAKCAKCGKLLCQDCVDSYGVSGGEYAGEALCYDCCQELVAANVRDLTKNKRKIKFHFILSIIGMSIGFIYGFIMPLIAMLSEGAFSGEALGAAFVTGIIAAGVGGCFLSFIKFYFSMLWQCLKVGFQQAFENGIWGVIGVFIRFIFEIVIAVFKCVFYTIKNTIDYIKYLKETSGFIESDTQALQQMKDYMEYTLVRSENKGVDLETLMGDNSVLANNSFARMVQSEGEDAAEASIRNCVASINENGEIIRSFAA